jgi:hypothetical protein
MLSQRQAAGCSAVAFAAALAFMLVTPKVVLFLLPFFLREEVIYAMIWFVVLTWPVFILLLVTGSLIVGIFAYRFAERKILRQRYAIE